MPDGPAGRTRGHRRGTREQQLHGSRAAHSQPANTPRGGREERTTAPAARVQAADYLVPAATYTARKDAAPPRPARLHPADSGRVASAGASSIKAQIESDTTLNSQAQSVRVTSAGNYGVYNINNIDYLGVEFIVEVIA